jgi:hypothetical protein
MAVYRIFPEKTATIYSRYPLFNAGLDPIMEIDSYYIGEDSYVARSLIAFNTSEQVDVIDNIIGDTNFTANIKMYLAEGEEAPTTYSINAYPLYEEWERGTGRFGDNPYVTDGVNWLYSKPSQYWTSPLVTNTTGSYTTVDVEGGIWYTGSFGDNLEHTQTHTVDSTHDIELNVTDSVKQHYSYSKGDVLNNIANNGFILKLDNNNEFQTERNIVLKYFSANTHTIYPPTLEFKWDDSIYDSELDTVSTDNITLSIKGNKGVYTDEGKQRFRLHVRPKFPPRTFATSSNYLTNYILPVETEWGIRDEHTEEMVIDFDKIYTRVSSDDISSYFDVYMGALQPERHYRVLIRSVIDGTSVVFNQDLVFKVVRNG